MARAKRKNARRGGASNHVYHFAVFSLLIFIITLMGTIGLSISGLATGYERAEPYTMGSFQMIAYMWILALAFLVPAELMIRKSRT